MPDEIMDALLGAVVGFLMGMIVCGFAAGCIEESKWQREAIDHGAAVWAIDPKTGETEFKWLTTNPEQE